MFTVSFLLPTLEQHVSYVWFSLVDFTEFDYTQSSSSSPYNLGFYTIKFLLFKKKNTLNTVRVGYKPYLQ